MGAHQICRGCQYSGTHQVFSHRQLLIQHSHPDANLHIIPNSIIQLPHTRLPLLPKQIRNIQHIAHQIDVPSQLEQLAGKLQRVRARQFQRAGGGEVDGYGGGGGRGEDGVG